MIQRLLAIWSLVSLPFRNPACTSGSSQSTYSWSLAWRTLSITFNSSPLCVLCHVSCVHLFATPWIIAHQTPLSWNFPAKNTGVGYHFLLQGIFLTQGSNSVVLFLVLWRLSILFSVMATVTTSTKQRVPAHPHPGQHLSISCLFQDSHSNRCEVALFCGFDLQGLLSKRIWLKVDSLCPQMTYHLMVCNKHTKVLSLNIY